MKVSLMIADEDLAFIAGEKGNTWDMPYIFNLRAMPITGCPLLIFFSFFDHNVMVTSREIIDYLFNATNIWTFEARNNYKMEIRKRS